MRIIPLKFIGAILLFSFTGFIWASNGQAATRPSIASSAVPREKTRGRAVEDKRFIVETDEESAAESLNRISGDVDRGYALPEQTYQSDHHTKPGAFQRSEEISSPQGASSRY